MLHYLEPRISQTSCYRLHPVDVFQTSCLVPRRGGSDNKPPVKWSILTWIKPVNTSWGTKYLPEQWWSLFHVFLEVFVHLLSPFRWIENDFTWQDQSKLGINQWSLNLQLYHNLLWCIMGYYGGSIAGVFSDLYLLHKLQVLINLKPALNTSTIPAISTGADFRGRIGWHRPFWPPKPQSNPINEH